MPSVASNGKDMALAPGMCGSVSGSVHIQLPRRAATNGITVTTNTKATEDDLLADSQLLHLKEQLYLGAFAVLTQDSLQIMGH